MLKYRLTDEQKKLVESCIPLAHLIAKRTYHPHIEYEDAVQIALIGVCRAAYYYTPGKSRFTTMAGLAAQHSIWMEERKYKNEVAKAVHQGRSLDSNIFGSDGNESTFHELVCDTRQDTYAQAEALITLSRVQEFKESLNKRDKKIFECVVLSHMRQTEVAKEMGLSQSYVSRVAKSLTKRVSNIIGWELLT